MDLKELYEKVNTNWSEMKHHMDQQQTEIKKYDTVTSETKQAVETHSTKIQELEEQLRTLRAGGGRPALDWKSAYGGQSGGDLVSRSFGAQVAHRFESKESEQRYGLFWRGLRPEGHESMSPPEVKTFRQLYSVRRGSDLDERYNTTSLSMSGGVMGDGGPDESKALSLGDDTAGGYLAPPEFIQDIIKGVQLISPIRPMAQIRQTSRRSVQYPVRSGVFAARWTQETGTRTETSGLTYALEEIPNHEMYALVFVSDQDLEDAVFNLEQEILDNCTEQFAKAEGAAFVNGTAIGQPEGLLTNTSVATDAYAGTNGWDATRHTLAASSVLNTWGQLKTVYAKNATWLMNRQTIVACRGLVDSQGRYLWEPGLADGTPPNLLGSPYIEVPDMPNLPASGSSTPILYGNIKRAYLIVDRIQVVVRRLQEKYAESGQIAYLVRKRVGGQVVLPEAVRKLQYTFS